MLGLPALSNPKEHMSWRSGYLRRRSTRRNLLRKGSGSVGTMAEGKPRNVTASLLDYNIEIERSKLFFEKGFDQEESTQPSQASQICSESETRFETAKCLTNQSN